MKIVCTTINGNKILIDKDKLILRKSVYGVIVDHEENILLVNTRSSGKWWFPGGVIDGGESNEETLAREVKEETGLVIKDQKLLTEVESYFYYDPIDAAYNQHSTFFLSKVESAEINTFENTDKNDEAEKPTWVSLESLKDIQMQDYGFEIIKLLKT